MRWYIEDRTEKRECFIYRGLNTEGDGVIFTQSKKKRSVEKGMIAIIGGKKTCEGRGLIHN